MMMMKMLVMKLEDVDSNKGDDNNDDYDNCNDNNIIMKTYVG